MIDTHVHYDHNSFNKTREHLLEECQNAGIDWMVNASIGFETNYTMREKLDKYPWIYYGIGIHPSRVGLPDLETDALWEEKIRTMTTAPRVVAIGETGLDYHHGKDDLIIEHQIYWFRKLLSIADENNLPLILHIREADLDAIEILKEYPLKDSGVVHCFNSGWNVAQFYLQKGLYLGLGGAITYPEKAELRDAVQKIPLERILLETDAPYVKPVDCQSTLNTSLELPKVVQAICELKGLSKEEVIQATTENAKRLFRIR